MGNSAYVFLLDCPLVDAVGKFPDEMWPSVPGKAIRLNDSIVSHTGRAFLFCEDVPVGTGIHLRFAVRLPLFLFGQRIGIGAVGFNALNIIAPIERPMWTATGILLN